MADSANTRTIEAAEQERILYAAPAALFDFIAAVRAEQWAVDKRPEYTFWLQADDDLDDATLDKPGGRA